jgi:hypothetical protein
LFDNRIPKRILGGSLGGRQLRDRLEDKVGQDAARLLSTKGCCMAATLGVTGGRKWEAMARKQAEHP